MSQWGDEQKLRHLRSVEDGVAVELVRAPASGAGLEDALAELRHSGLLTRARQVAEDFKSPARHKDLTVAEWCCLATRMVGDVADQVFGMTVVGGPRPVRQARTAIERAIGLLLVLDDELAAHQDADQGA